MLFIFCLFTVFTFGGCGGDSTDESDFIQPGRYYAVDGENYDNPDWEVSYYDSYIRVFHFEKVNFYDYELSFSGVIFWLDTYGNSYARSIPQRNILMTRIDDGLYETKSSSAPYVLLEIFNEEIFDLYTEEFMVSLEFNY